MPSESILEVTELVILFSSPIPEPFVRVEPWLRTYMKKYLLENW